MLCDVDFSRRVELGTVYLGAERSPVDRRSPNIESSSFAHVAREHEVLLTAQKNVEVDARHVTETTVLSNCCTNENEDEMKASIHEEGSCTQEEQKGQHYRHHPLFYCHDFYCCHSHLCISRHQPITQSGDDAHFLMLGKAGVLISPKHPDLAFTRQLCSETVGTCTNRRFV